MFENLARGLAIGLAMLMPFIPLAVSAQTADLPPCSATAPAWDGCTGRYEFPSGDVYEGAFRNDAFHGEGTYTFADGRRYVGEFRNNQIHGRGTLFLADGSVDSHGLFVNGQMVTPEPYEPQSAATAEQRSEEPRSAPPAATAETTAALGGRTALVVGNSAYQKLDPLESPAQDAAAIADLLAGMGFDVVLARDLDTQAFQASVDAFAEKSGRAEMALFFYAGHAIQVGDYNYLIPVDARLADYSEPEADFIRLDAVTGHLGAAGQTGIVLVDAPRDNPFNHQIARDAAPLASAGPAADGGLALCFATAPGRPVQHGAEGTNSPFTYALLQYLAKPDLGLGDQLAEVGTAVLKYTKGAQIPWCNSSLPRKVFLGRGP